MKYSSETVQDLFHRLPVNLQIAITKLEDELADLGYLISIQQLTPDGELQIVIRIAN